MRLIVPLDGSSLAEQAVKYVTQWFRSREAEVALVWVLSPEEKRQGISAQDTQESGWPAEDEQHAQAYLDMVAWQLEDAGYTVKSYVLRGTPGSIVPQLAELLDADLIVMTTHGQGMARSNPMGRTATTVVERSRCPVLLVPVRDQIHVDHVSVREHVAT